MTWLEVLVEGASDLPTVKEVLERKFHLVDGRHFRIHPHKGKGKLPKNPLSKPDIKHQGLLDQLPAKLRGFGKSLPQEALVLVLVDLDKQSAQGLLRDLEVMLAALPVKPKVMFRLAIEETESWFIADLKALQMTFPGQVKKHVLKNIKPDAIVGAAQKLAEALGLNPLMISGPTKFHWAKKIAPHLDLDNPASPSFRSLIDSIGKIDGLLEPIQ